MIQITSSLTGKKAPFTPLTPGKVRMYVCGPTVYGLIHIGNARPAVFFDVVRRYLEFRGFEVTYVRNYTDVDDKIINRAREEKCASSEISEKYILEYDRDMESLKVRTPDIRPKVTGTMPQIIQMIETLVRNGAAYVVEDGEVLYSVRKFKEYGKLSGKKIDELMSGARIEPGEKKQDPLDFALWKPQKAVDEPAWDSPWGKGRPGWHIECSAMALQYLGETFDIHGGGIDLIHPHHENEIAQSEAANGKEFAKIWMHNNLLNINKEKMSKSLGNIFLTRDFVTKYGAESLKYMLLSAHYRSPIDFAELHIREGQAALHRFYSAMRRCERLQKTAKPGKESPEIEKTQKFAASFEANWIAAMDDDFNTAKALGLVFEYVRLVNSVVDAKGVSVGDASMTVAKDFLSNMKKLSAILNLLGENAENLLAQLRRLVLEDRKIEPGYIEEQIRQRTVARQNKDYAKSDQIRNDLAAKGIEIRDTPQGTEWDVVLVESAT